MDSGQSIPKTALGCSAAFIIQSESGHLLSRNSLSVHVYVYEIYVYIYTHTHVYTMFSDIHIRIDAIHYFRMTENYQCALNVQFTHSCETLNNLPTYNLLCF